MRSGPMTATQVLVVCAAVGLGRILWLTLLLARAPSQPTLDDDFAGLQQAVPPRAELLFLGDPPMDSAHESPGVRAYFRASCALAPRVLATVDHGQEFVVAVALTPERRDALAGSVDGQIIATSRVAAVVRRAVKR